MTGFLDSFSGSMSDFRADGAAGRNSDTRRPPTEQTSREDDTGEAPPLADERAGDAVRPAERSASAAALAVADQIMGLDGMSVGMQPGRPLALRSPGAQVFAIDRHLAIGRSADAELTVGDGRVSRSHAAVSRSDGQYVVRDLGSGNGTFIARNGELARVGAEPMQIQPGDRLETIDGLLLAEVVEVG